MDETSVKIFKKYYQAFWNDDTTNIHQVLPGPDYRNYSYSYVALKKQPDKYFLLNPYSAKLKIITTLSMYNYKRLFLEQSLWVDFFL